MLSTVPHGSPYTDALYQHQVQQELQQPMPTTTTASPAATAAWRKFEQCLALQGLTFEDVKDADAGARLELIASIGGTSLVFASTTNTANSGNNASNLTPADVMLAAATAEAAPALSGVEMALVSSRWNALVPTATSGASIPQGVNSNTRGGPNGQFAPNVSSTLPFLDPTHGRSLLHRGTTDLLDELKRHLSVGNSAPALAIAAELLHRDPIPMLRVLNEFAPHLSLAQLQEILGVRASAAAAANTGPQSRVGGINNAFSPTIANNLQLTGSAQGLNITNLNRKTVPTLNDIPLRVGAVLTEGALASQFGAGFRATFSATGRVVQLPHCVQEGDSITVLKSSEVIR